MDGGDFLENMTYFPPTINGCLFGFEFLKKSNQSQNILYIMQGQWNNFVQWMEFRKKPIFFPGCAGRCH